MHDLLVVVSRQETAPVLAPLAAALNRKGAAWSCFVTGSGVRALTSPEVVAALKTANPVFVCEHSWESEMGAIPAPLPPGSQFHHSDLLSHTRRVLSL